MKRQERRAIKLGDVCEKPQYGYTASAQREEVGPKFLRITDLREGAIDWDTVPCCKVDKTGAQRYGLHHGDVLVARIGATTGSTSIVVNPPPSVFASYLIRLRPTREMHPFFLYFYTKSEQFHQWIDAHKDSNLKGGVNVPTLLSAPLTLPVLAEQQKIAAVLWKMQRAIATQDRLIAATRDLKQSAMQHLFTHGLRDEPLKDTAIGAMPESWEPTTIGDIASVGSGGTPSRANPAYWLNGTIPWVKTGEVGYCVINDTEEKITPDGLRNSAAKIYPKGTLLMAMYGQGVTRGKVAILGVDASINQACAAIQTHDDRTHPDFLYYVLSHNYESLRGLAHGGQQQNLNADLIRGFPFGLPTDVGEQRDIAAALATIDRKLAHHQQKRATLNDLFQTTLHQLMTAQIRVADLDIDISEVSDHFPDVGKMVARDEQDHVADASNMVDRRRKRAPPDHFVDANEMIVSKSRRPRR